jgi:hypothetical protein
MFGDEFDAEESQGRGAKIDIAKVMAEIKENAKNKELKEKVARKAMIQSLKES